MTSDTTGRKTRLTHEELELLKLYRAKGLSYAKIGKKFGITAPSVMYHLNNEYYRKVRRKNYAATKAKQTKKAEDNWVLLWLKNITGGDNK